MQYSNKKYYFVFRKNSQKSRWQACAQQIHGHRQKNHWKNADQGPRDT